MTTDVIPILRVADASIASVWYERLGFRVEFEHRFEPHLPAYVGIRREGAQIHLSEHAGDARPHTLIYVWVDDIETVAATFERPIDEAPWGREVSLVDPDGNRLRVAQATAVRAVEAELGTGTSAALAELEAAMWDERTRGDREWMDAHLTDDFTEVGYSGRTHTRAEILDLPIGSIEVAMDEMSISALGRDGALITYRTVEPRGVAHRASVWRRSGGTWLLAFHQGTPVN